MTLRGVLARNLRRLRSVGRLSQEEVASQAGLNRNYVGMIEREEHAATVDVLEQLAAVFAVEPAELLRSDNKAGSLD
jgi:transcriptional regulator with XRE-family HTH domain